MKKTRNKRVLVALAVLAGVAAAAAADLPPGYTWGLYNCGPAVNNSRENCMLCCREGLLNGFINVDEYDGCRQMCNDSIFNRPGRFIRWLASVLA